MNTLIAFRLSFLFIAVAVGAMAAGVIADRGPDQWQPRRRRQRRLRAVFRQLPQGSCR